MEITKYTFSEEGKTVTIRVEHADERLTISTDGVYRSVSGRSLAGSRHNEVCKAMAIALQKMLSGDDIDSYF